MGLRGPKPKRSDGCHVNRKGYLRRFIYLNGKQKGKLAHHLVWEKHHGPVPDGYQIHHINGDKQDNRIENLQLVTPVEHKRLHSGCVLNDGEWWKPCSACGEQKPINQEHWYLSPQGSPLYGRCRPCHCASVRQAYHARRNSRRPE